MSKHRRALAVFIAAVLYLLLHVEPAAAQAMRTWVSGTGNDADPCSRTQPCKTFAAAIANTQAGGEISVLDAGGYGPLIISKSLSIIGEGAEASISASAVNAISIEAGADDVVNLHGLFIDGHGSGLNGIKIVSAGSVHIRKCLIRGMTNAISVEPGASASIFISDCTLASNAAGLVANTGSGFARIFLDRVQVVQNQAGVRGEGSRVTIHLNHSTLAHNVGAALASVNGARILSFGNNAISGDAPRMTTIRTR